jgi:hypothetical protein
VTVNGLSADGFDAVGLLAVGVNAVRSVTAGRLPGSFQTVSLGRRSAYS